jgi:hypothetical protein
MKIDTFYGDSIFTHQKNDLIYTSTEDNYKEFDKIFDDCIDIYCDDYSITEGANIDIWESFNTHKKAYRKALSSAHLHMRKKEWVEASQFLSTAKKEIDECKKEVKSTESDVSSVAFGFLLNSTLSMIMDIIPGMTYIIGVSQDSVIGSEIRKSIALPAVGSKTVSKISKVSKTLIKNDIKTAKQIISAKNKCDKLISYSKGIKAFSYTTKILYAVSHIIDDIYGIVKAFREDEKNERLSIDKMNVYKNNIIKTLNNFSDIIEKESKAVKEKQKKESRKS